MFCIPKARNSVYSHLFPYNKQISLGSLLPSTSLSSPPPISIECDVPLRIWNDINNKSIFSRLCFYRISSPAFRAWIYIDLISHAVARLNKVQSKKQAIMILWPLFPHEETNSHNKFVSELYPQVRKGSRAFVRLFLRPFRSFVYSAWCLVGSVRVLCVRRRASRDGYYF